MDLSTLPDLAQHFAFAAHFTPDYIQRGVEYTRQFARAFGGESPFTINEKLFHGGKCVALAALFAFTVAEGSVEGMIGTAFAEADTVYTICNAGSKVHPKEVAATRSHSIVISSFRSASPIGTKLLSPPSASPPSLIM